MVVRVIDAVHLVAASVVGPIGLATIAALGCEKIGRSFASYYSAVRRAVAQKLGTDIVDPSQTSPFKTWEEHAG